MTRFLDWLDESAAGLIRVAYLLAGVIAVASYFSDGNVPRAFSDFLNAILPWALAGALEIHTYLTARRVRQAWQDWSAAALGSDEHERAGAQMKLNLWILGALLTFSMYNQLQYLAATWRPPHTPLTPPGPWAYIIRAIITPAAFMAAAFLAPVGEGLALQVQSQAHALALATFKVATQQWKRRLKQMQQAGQDVTGALVQLVDDPAERRVIEAIWQAMQHPGQLPAPAAQQTALGDAGVAQSAQTAIGAPAHFEPSQQPHTATQEAAQSASTQRPVISAGSVPSSAPERDPERDPDPDPDPEPPTRRPRRGAQPEAAQGGPDRMPTAFPRRSASGGAVATQAPAARLAQGTTARARRTGGRKALASYERHAREALRARRLDQTIAMLASEPEISVKKLAKTLHSGEATAKNLRARALQLMALRGHDQRAAMVGDD